MDAMTKMWISFGAIGLLLLASGIVSFARARTKGFLRVILTIVAVIALIYGVILGYISIM
jgi:hypothetical protein